MLSAEPKEIFDMNPVELADYKEAKLMEFKELFLTTDMPVDEIYKKIGVSIRDPVGRYINGSRKRVGCSAKDRNVDFNIMEQTTEERYAELEEFYQKFKELWLSDPKMSKKKAFELLGKTQKK